MSTPVAERVRQFRERQRRANPREPHWRDLIGKLNVAATWLDLGNHAPGLFIATLREVATKAGLEVREQLPCRGYGAQPDVDNSE